MGRYFEALTRLLLEGAFPGGGKAAAPARHAPVSKRFARTRALRAAPAATPLAAKPIQIQTARHRRVGRARKIRPTELGSVMIHPGQILAKHLSDLGMTASDLARDIDVPVNRVTAIINGQRGVTADTALRLAHWFGVEPEDWLELQLQFELALARQEVGAKINRLPRLVDRVE